MYGLNSSQFASAAFLWPALIAESASEIASAAARELVSLAVERQPQTSTRDLEWATPNRVALELFTVRLRDFSTSAEDTPALICAPFALHAATLTDFATGHSLVAALQTAGIRRVFVTDWRSASPDMRFLSIDNYLADLNVVVDELGGRVNVIGLCQGGWMALIYASRFPSKVKKLALAAAPINIAVGNSHISELAHKTPMVIFRELVDIGCGRMIGQHALQFWSPSFDRETIRKVLQLPHETSSEAFGRLEARFREWYASTLDLPGAYYLQVVEHLFKENRLAAGRFVALGRKVDLSALRCPL
jgi:poly(3-hydroxyalkanoate) synthetase